MKTIAESRFRIDFSELIAMRKQDAINRRQHHNAKPIIPDQRKLKVRRSIEERHELRELGLSIEDLG